MGNASAAASEPYDGRLKRVKPKKKKSMETIGKRGTKTWSLFASAELRAGCYWVLGDIIGLLFGHLYIKRTVFKPFTASLAVVAPRRIIRRIIYIRDHIPGMLI